MRVLVKPGHKGLSVHLVDDKDKQLCKVALNLVHWTIQERLRHEVTICHHCLRIEPYVGSHQDVHPASVFFTIVVSSAVYPLSVPELCDVVLAGRACYESYNLTGMLLYRDGNFMLFLEGDEVNVRHMLALSARDPRQLLITPILEGFTHKRQYPDWSMAFPTVDSDNMRFIRGFSTFLNTPHLDEVGATDLTEAQTLLLAFKQYIGSAV